MNKAMLLLMMMEKIDDDDEESEGDNALGSFKDKAL